MLDRLESIAIPRIRDFRGLNPRSFDGRGNYSIGIREQIIFPEIDYDAIDQVRGLDVTITTTAPTDEEAFELLRLLGLPFRREESDQQPSRATGATAEEATEEPTVEEPTEEEPVAEEPAAEEPAAEEPAAEEPAAEVPVAEEETAEDRAASRGGTRRGDRRGAAGPAGSGRSRRTRYRDLRSRWQRSHK